MAGFVFVRGRHVARPPSPVVAARNQEIYSLFTKGSSVNDLAKQFKLTPQRIGQVVASQNPETDEDYDRSLYRGYLWRLFEEVRELYRSPGFKMSPTGRPAEDPDGDPAEDTNVKLQAAELELKILESLRKMDARDRPAKKEVTYAVDIATQQASADIARRRAEIELAAAERRELEELRSQQQAIPGEVVRELPAAGA